jgi:SAM-dependent methyltransferase
VKRAAHAAYAVTRIGLERWLLDRRYGLPAETWRRIDLDEFTLEHPERSYYHPSPWGVLGRVLAAQEVEPDDVFLDLGCGFGRVVIEATLYPFRRVLGVEIVPELVKRAGLAVAANNRRSRCQATIVLADASTFCIPDDVTVIFMNNPFLGETFKRVIANIIESVDRAPRRVRLVYLHPAEAARLTATGRVSLLRYGRRGLRRWQTTPALALYEIVA